jgi:hypothetical protein
MSVQKLNIVCHFHTAKKGRCFTGLFGYFLPARVVDLDGEPSDRPDVSHEFPASGDEAHAAFAVAESFLLEAGSI